MFDCFIFLDLMGPPSLRRQERTSHSHDTDSASRHERLYLHSLVTTDLLDANYPRHLSPAHIYTFVYGFAFIATWIVMHTWFINRYWFQTLLIRMTRCFEGKDQTPSLLQVRRDKRSNGNGRSRPRNGRTMRLMLFPALLLTRCVAVPSGSPPQKKNGVVRNNHCRWRNHTKGEKIRH